MSAYDNVVVGKLKLKGMPLDLKLSGVQKKNKKRMHYSPPAGGGNENAAGDNTTLSKHNGDNEEFIRGDHLTPAERRYLEQTQKLEPQKLAKMARKSHRDRIHEFNQCLANLTEHYDIPKVGPG
ncbi:PREDICTED: protein FAM32A-like [Tarenaya hassleriana]|uniref:protein FAM32A-like n=1 Tax=Tarenaya hassleriana TaxID=28532 RepID=UPI00053C166E|nr:PREDICTED: protein FAM32A-like [Tarenaya hassleriana]XP_010526277.1 PREDICTED: protein FAM32A-like [Tarenaya hassleriana]